ncbi:MAG: N-acetyltransferase [Acidobacteria bacterium]|nr:N-acetyltransferase [Acidobacteriota bacterium]MBI3655278.1 N-acetyltransferase [Acidobacteriota bacterium]
MAEKDYFVHESAYVDEPVTIGKGSKIWHFSHIMAGAVLGERCVVGQNVNIGGGAVLGNNVKVQNNVSIYDAVILEDDVFCGPSMVFTNVINPRSHIVRKDEYQVTRVKRGATLGANCTIICGVTIGRYAFVGAGAVVTRDVTDFSLVYGSPARRQGYVCRCGVRLGFRFGDDYERVTCSSCSAEYEKGEDGVSEILYLDLSD